MITYLGIFVQFVFPVFVIISHFLNNSALLPVEGLRALNYIINTIVIDFCLCAKCKHYFRAIFRPANLRFYRTLITEKSKRCNLTI